MHRVCSEYGEHCGQAQNCFLAMLCFTANNVIKSSAMMVSQSSMGWPSLSSKITHHLGAHFVHEPLYISTPFLGFHKSPPPPHQYSQKRRPYIHSWGTKCTQTLIQRHEPSVVQAGVMHQLVQRLFAELALGARLALASAAGAPVVAASTVHMSAYSLGPEERIVDLLRGPGSMAAGKGSISRV